MRTIYNYEAETNKGKKTEIATEIMCISELLSREYSKKDMLYLKNLVKDLETLSTKKEVKEVKEVKEIKNDEILLKDIFKAFSKGHEITINDSSIDIEFYIYKEDKQDNALVKYLIENASVKIYKNGNYVIDFISILKPKQKELYNEFAIQDKYDNINDIDFLYDLIEDIEKFVSLGYEETSKKIVSILENKK